MLKDKKTYFESLLKHLENDKLSVSMLFVTRNKQNNSYAVYKGTLADDIGEVLRKMCLKIAKRSYSKPEVREFKPYNSAHKLSESSEYLDGKEIKQIEPMLKMISDNIIDLKELDDKFLDHLWYYVIKFDDGTNQMLFYKKYSKSMVLTKGIALALTFRAGSFDKLKSHVFRIEDKADCIYYKEKLIIRSKGNFEKIFNFFQEIKRNAESAIKFIEEKLPFKIENFDAIKTEMMKHEIKMRKLNNIYATKTLEKINPNNIEPLIKEGILKNITLSKDAAGKITLSSTDPWEILKILDDDIVRSRLTEIDYEATYKKEISK